MSCEYLYLCFDVSLHNKVPSSYQVEKTVCCLCCTSRPIVLKGMIDKGGVCSRRVHLCFIGSSKQQF